MLSSPWGTFLPVVLGTLHQSETSYTPSLRFVIPLQRPCQAFLIKPDHFGAKFSSRSSQAPYFWRTPLRSSWLPPVTWHKRLVTLVSWFRPASALAPGRGPRLLVPRLRRTLHRMRLRRPPHRVNPQHHSAAHLAALQPVPFPDIRVRHTELVRNPAQRIPAPHPVPHQPALGLFHRPCRRNNQLLARLQPRPRLQVVGRRDRPRRHPVLLRNRRQRLSALHPVPPPAHPLVRGNIRDLRRKRFRGPLRQVQRKRRIIRRRHPQQRRIQRSQRGHVHVNRLRHQPQVDRPPRFHHIGLHRLLRVHGDPIMRGVLGDQRQRQDDRHIVLRLPRQHVPLVEFPEIRVTRPLHALLHVSRSAVVSRNRQVPVSKKPVKIPQVLRRRPRRFLRIHPLVHPPGPLQSILVPAPLHELPDPSRPGPG